jgi:hypothetical protein
LYAFFGFLRLKKPKKAPKTVILAENGIERLENALKMAKKRPEKAEKSVWDGISAWNPLNFGSKTPQSAENEEIDENSYENDGKIDGKGAENAKKKDDSDSEIDFDS